MIFDKFNNWAKINKIKSYKDKCKVLLLRENQMHKYNVGNNWLGEIIVEKDLQVLDHKYESTMGYSCVKGIYNSPVSNFQSM